MATQTASDLPQLAGVTHRTVDLPGLRMHVAEAGDGNPILLLHGFPEHWWQWHAMIPSLATRYRVLCPDLRGAGWTDAPSGGYTRDQLVSDLVALLDALDLPRVRMISHDMGSISGFGLCIDHPERVEQHVALAVPPPFISFSPRLLPLMRHLWFQQALALPGVGQRLAGGGRQRLPRYLFSHFSPPGTWSADSVETYLSRLRDPAHARAASALYRDMVLPESTRILRGVYRRTRLTTPTMLLFGAADTAFPPPIARALLADRERYADDVRLAFIDGAGHFVPDEQPGQVVEQALRFFEDAGGG